MKKCADVSKKKTYDPKQYMNELKEHLVTSPKNFKFLKFPSKNTDVINKKFGILKVEEKKENLFDPSLIKNIKCDKLNSRKDNLYLTKTIKLFLTNKQKEYTEIIFNAYIAMYNDTITYICETIKCGIEVSDDINIFRSDLQKNKDKISEKYIIIVNDKHKKIPSHTLNFAINDALNAYNSCITNMERNHIKNFRLRKLKFSKKNKIFKLEKLSFQQNGFLGAIFGKKIKCSEKDYNYKENCLCVSIVTKRNGEYYLLSKQIKEFEPTKGNHIASIDPGIKTMLTIYSDDGITEIGSKKFLEKNIVNANKIMKKQEKLKEKYLDKLNELKKYTETNKFIEENKNNPDKIIQKELTKIKKLKKSKRTDKFIEQRYENIDEIIQKKAQKIKNKKYNKIKNQVKDFQWKIANYLTGRFKTILFGNMSTKKTGETKGHKLTKETGKMLSFYTLKEKIKNRCLHKKVNYKEVNEAFTSCICGNCGNCKTNLGCDNVYNCLKCKIKVGRDINGARNILIASTRIK